MAGETIITIVGNLTADPELRFTPSGAAVANFTVASTPRTFDRQTNEWKDGETLFMRCSIWREAAENIAESLHRGTRVIATGRLKSRSYETKEGEKRTVIELDVDEVGPSLRYASAKVTKAQRGGSGGGFGGQGGGQRLPTRGPPVGPRRLPSRVARAVGVASRPLRSSPPHRRVASRVAGARPPATTSPPSDRTESGAPHARDGPPPPLNDTIPGRPGLIRRDSSG